MRKLNQTGSLVLPFIIVFVLMLSALGFGGWAFMGRQDYKNNSDKKAAVAAAAAAAEEAKKKDAEFAEAEKSPLKTYKGPETYGGVSFLYPKTWSAFISENGKGTTPVDGYLQPGYVPDITSDTAMALRIQIVNTPYAQLLKAFDAGTKSGKVKVSAYRAPKVESTLGAKIEGEIGVGKKVGTMVLLPIRDKTIRIWTEGPDAVKDFNDTILATLTFSP